MSQFQGKKYILTYGCYGFAPGSVYTVEGDYLIHRDIEGNVLHKIQKEYANNSPFQDVDSIDEHKIHKDLLRPLLNKTLKIRVSAIGLGNWWWEGASLAYKLIGDEKMNTYAFIPQAEDFRIDDEAHKMLETLNLEFKGANKYAGYQTLRKDFKQWFNSVLEKSYLGALNFYIKDILSIEHNSNDIKSITLTNKTKIFIL